MANEEGTSSSNTEEEREEGGGNKPERTTNPAPSPSPSPSPSPGANRSVSDGQMRVIVLLLVLLGLEVLRSPQVRNFFTMTFKTPFTQAVSQQSGAAQGTSLTALQKMTGRTTA